MNLKKKGQAESQTDRAHLYYLKVYNNKPIIIIDSQGFGDTRGKTYDETTNEKFRFVFSNVVTHINIVRFIAKSTYSRIDINTLYLIGSITSLFSADITGNFIILSTFSNIEICEKRPYFIKSIETVPEFQKFKNIMDEKCGIQ